MGVVAVIGGGPAGSAAAYAAANAGAQVLMFERSGPNRDKACGDALVKEAVPELRGMGIRDARDISGEIVVESSLEGADGTLWRKPHPDDCWIAPRTLLDQTLRGVAQSAGTDLRYKTSVLDVEQDPRGRFRLKTRNGVGLSEIQADAVVLAHGVNGRLSADWGIDGLPIKVPAVSRYQNGAPPKGLHFRFEPEKYGPGYVWEFPVDSASLNVGIFSLERTDIRSAMNKYEAAAESASAVAPETTKWRGAYEPLWTGEGRAWCAGGGGIISCGDAAGVVDPLTGEGIGPALLTGRMAGLAAAEFAQGSPEAAKSYSHWLYDWAGRKYDINHGRRKLRSQLNNTGFTTQNE